MLIIKNIYLKNCNLYKESVSFLSDDVVKYINGVWGSTVIFDIFSVYNSLDSLYFDILDTSSNILHKLIKFDKVLNMVEALEDILGVVSFKKETIFIKVSDFLWEFLDMCDEPKGIEYTNLPLQMKEGCLSVSNSCTYTKEFICTNNNKAYVVADRVRPMDVFGLFWRIDSLEYNYVTLLDIYMKVLKELRGSYTDLDIDDSDIYLFCTDNLYYKLEFNKDINKLLTKLLVLHK